MTAALRDSLGQVWFTALRDGPDQAPAGPASLLVGEACLSNERAGLLAIVPDPAARFPRARHGEVGLEEGWAFAAAVRGIMHADEDAAWPRPIVIVVDVPSQAYGYVEELAGLHQTLAAAADALATARLRGHPTVALIVGKAVSGAFLAVGLQAGRLLALDHDEVVVQVMSRQSAARITRRSVEELAAVARLVPATAYDGASFARLGALHALVHAERPFAPTEADTAVVREALRDAVADLRAGGPGLEGRLRSVAARQHRAASILVRERVAAEWDA
jgi:malonate decarboxylase gamma subunit